jgi:DNA-binding Lrp family transcriptional regulator
MRDDIAQRTLEAILASEQRATHAELAEVARVSPRTITNVISRLSQLGIVKRRPAALGPACGLALALVADREWISGAMVDANGLLHHTRQVSFERHLTSRSFVETVRQLARSTITAAQEDPELSWPEIGRIPLLGVALSRSSLQSDPRELAEWGDRRSGLGNDFGRLIFNELLGPDQVSLVDHCHAESLALAFKRSREAERKQGWTDPKPGSRRFLVVRVDETITARAVELSQLSEGFDFRTVRRLGGADAGTELGHVPVDVSFLEALSEQRRSAVQHLDMDLMCSCGRRGHLEAVVGTRGVMRRLGMPEDEDGRLLASLEARGDSEMAAEVLGDSGRILARHLASAISLLEPTEIAISGALASRPLVFGFEQEFRRYVKPRQAETTSISLFRSTESRLLGAGLSLLLPSVYRDLSRLARLDREGGNPITTLDRKMLKTSLR